MPPDIPRFVPTLTEIVEVAPAPPATALPPAMATVAAMADERLLADDLAEQIAHRVLQRVDAMLAERLSEAIRLVVKQHTQTLLPAVREEIVVCVHATVAEALAEEFLPLPPPLQQPQKPAT